MLNPSFRNTQYNSMINAMWWSIIKISHLKRT
jgi:hypothetical protein